MDKVFALKEFKRKYEMVPRSVARVETLHRRIVTELPVPESIPVLERLERYEPASMQGQPPVVIDRAEGMYVHDKWGNKWLDWSSGVFITNTGHGPAEVLEALRVMLEKPLLATYVFPHEGRAELVELLAGLAPGPGYRVFLLSTGSEATENCIKLAKTYGMERHGGGKRVIVSFKNAFHGRTMGAQLAGGNDAQKKWLGCTDNSFVQVPFPDGYKNTDTRFELFLETLESAGVTGDMVCGVITESYQGVGPDFLPVEYARRLEEWCRAHDAVLVMDEVQAGFGRTGKWFAFEHYGIKPDLIACGKGISGSMPLSAVIGRREVMDLYAPGSMTSTHSASPLPVAAAVANIKMLHGGGYIANAAAMEPVLHSGLLEMQKEFPANIGCVTCLGLVAGLQMVKPGTKEPDNLTALRINEECFRRGLLMFAPVGIGGECIKIAPPLCITRDAVLEGLGVLGESLKGVLGR